MKVYVVYESLYGDYLYDCDSTNILGVYQDIESAFKRLKLSIDENCSEDFECVLDENYSDGDMVAPLYYQEQDNFSKYLNVIIEEREVR